MPIVASTSADTAKIVSSSMLKSERAVDRATMSSMVRGAATGSPPLAWRSAVWMALLIAVRLAARANDPGQRRDVHEIGAVGIRHLRPRHVHDGLRIPVEPAVAHIPGDADNLAPRQFQVRTQALANRDAIGQRVAARPESGRHGLV